MSLSFLLIGFLPVCLSSAHTTVNELHHHQLSFKTGHTEAPDMESEGGGGGEGCAERWRRRVCHVWMLGTSVSRKTHWSEVFSCLSGERPSHRRAQTS